MAKINQGILGGFRGKCGSVIGSNFKGIATMRAMPVSVSNPRTAAQVGNRTRFTEVQRLAGEIGTTLIQKYWNRQATKMSGYNLFCSVNKDAFDSVGTFQMGHFYPQNGSIEPPAVGAASFNITTGALSVAVNYTIRGERLATDKMQVIVIDEYGVLVGISEEETAQTKTITATLDPYTGDSTMLACWVINRRADSTKTGIYPLATSLVLTA